MIILGYTLYQLAIYYFIGAFATVFLARILGQSSRISIVLFAFFLWPINLAVLLGDFVRALFGR